MRLFIAINFDESTKQRLMAAQDRLRKYGQGNFTRPENLHLTLAFLGEVAPKAVAAIHQAMEHTPYLPLTLRFDHAGSFRRQGGDIWWVGIAHNKPLLSLQQELCDNLRAAGFALESRSFTPHITLARDLQLKDQPNPKALLGEAFETKASVISLMRSERIGGKLVYTQQFALGRGD